MLVSPEVIAAEVSLLTADEPLHAAAFHHVTLFVDKGHMAFEANQLPQRLAAGEAGVWRAELGAAAQAAAADVGGVGGGGVYEPLVVVGVVTVVPN